MSGNGGKGSDPASGIIGSVVQDGVTTGVAIGSFLALNIPIVGPFAAAAGFGFIGIRAVIRGYRNRRKK